MKALLIALSLALAWSAGAQQLLVRFYRDVPTDTNTLAGIPGDWPRDVREVGTNTAVLPTWSTNMSRAQYLAHRSALEPAVLAWRQNLESVEEDRKRANIQALLELYQRFLEYEELSRTGTPTQAQVILEVRRLNGAMLRLGPVLRDLYKGDE